MEQPLSRRAWLTGLVSGASAFAAACGPGGLGVTELNTPEGRVLQWEGDDLLVLVSGFQQRYRVGEVIRLTLLANNQTTRPAQVRLRTKLLGLGDQAVVEAEVAMLAVRPEDAGSIQRELPLPRSLRPGEYTLSVEVPPWRVDGRETGRGASLRARVQVEGAE